MVMTAALLILSVLLLADLRSGLRLGPTSNTKRGVWLSKQHIRLGASVSSYLTSKTGPRRPQIADFLSQQCADVADEHELLIQDYLRPWAKVGITAETTRSWPLKRMYLHNDSIYLHPGMQKDALVPTFLFQLEVSHGRSSFCRRQLVGAS